MDSAGKGEIHLYKSWDLNTELTGATARRNMIRTHVVMDDDVRRLLQNSPHEFSCLCGAVDVALVQGSRVVRGCAQSLVELELQHETHEIPATTRTRLISPKRFCIYQGRIQDFGQGGPEPKICSKQGVIL